MDLVIGGTGFLGGEIVDQLLQRGRRVRSFCRRRPDATANNTAGGAELFFGDISDRDSLMKACKGIETVYHTASWPSISVRWRPFYETNVLGAQNVIEACRENGVRRLIYTSSASVCFDCNNQAGVDETAPYPEKWYAHYPHSKAIAEKMILDLADNDGGLLTCSLRPHLIIGKKDRHLFPRLFDRAARGKLFRVGDGANLIDIIFVENAALAHIQAAEALTDEKSPVNGNAYFVSQGEPVNCWNWIDDILSLRGLPKVKKSISFNTAWQIGAAMEAWYKICGFTGEPLMTRFLSAQLAQTHYLNISKAKKDFGYCPIIGMSEGMEQLAKIFREKS